MSNEDSDLFVEVRDEGRNSPDYSHTISKEVNIKHALNWNTIVKTFQSSIKRVSSIHCGLVLIKWQIWHSYKNSVSQSVVSQAFFFLPNVGFLPILELVVLDGGSSPRSMAKTPNPRKGKYKYNSLSEALPDWTSSDNIVTWNFHKTNKR